MAGLERALAGGSVSCRRFGCRRRSRWLGDCAARRGLSGGRRSGAAACVPHRSREGCALELSALDMVSVRGTAAPEPRLRHSRCRLETFGWWVCCVPLQPSTQASDSMCLHVVGAAAAALAAPLLGHTPRRLAGFALGVGSVAPLTAAFSVLGYPVGLDDADTGGFDAQHWTAMVRCLAVVVHGRGVIPVTRYGPKSSTCGNAVQRLAIPQVQD